MMKSLFAMRVFRFIPFAGLSIAVFLVIYISGQQIYRTNANDPQIQMADDASRFLNRGGKPSELLSQTSRVDLLTSLLPFIAIYDSTGKLIGTNAFFDSTPISIPATAITSAKEGKQNRITWQAKNGIRSALVVNYFTQGPVFGYVAVGRALKEIENRISDLGKICFFAWIATNFFVFILVSITTPKVKRYS